MRATGYRLGRKLRHRVRDLLDYVTYLETARPVPVPETPPEPEQLSTEDDK